MKIINVSFSVAILYFIVSCASTVQSTFSKPNIKLKNYNKVVVRLTDASGASSLSTTLLKSGSGALLGGHMMKGEDQGKQALESFQFEMMSIGFEFVSDEAYADALVEFSIGQIRYDPLAGWIADQATVKFKDFQTGQIVAFYRAKTQFITPTVKNIIRNLAEEIRKSY